MYFGNFPRRGYVQAPTPIEACPRFSEVLGGKVNIYIKRDDLLPGAAGGNKTRKLDFCLAEALTLGADSVITCGAPQSNHCRLTLAWANKEGLDCHLILEERVAGGYKPEASGNNFLFDLLGVKSVRVVPAGSDMLAAMDRLAGELKSSGKNPYIIPGGASTPLGSLGYAACADEIMRQLFTDGLRIDQIVTPSGSAGTHAGLLVGLTAGNAGIPLSGINVSRPSEVQNEIVFNLAQKTLDLLELKLDLDKSLVRTFGDYYAPGYSIPNPGMAEAVTLLARTESILLDPVYSGKAMAGLIDLVRKDYFRPGSNILFLHTGGSPALYAYESYFHDQPVFNAGLRRL